MAIGVDSNQNPIKPGRIVSSLLKRIDIITYNLLKSVASKEAVPQQNQAGIREGAFDWVVDDHNLDFIDLNIKNAIDRAQVAIASGAITVKKSQDSAECNRIWQEQL